MMNPPSALHGAMSRDRKPFTYTPGGLDLSEIKSERMAKRLMRNAMNQGVPEVPVQSIQSPPMASTPIAVPNYNCLPVQVFPAFNLPANPKTLLRTRSHPDQPRDLPTQRVPASSHFVNNEKSPGIVNYDTFSKPAYAHINNNRPMSMFEYGTAPNNNNNTYRNSYGSDGYSTYPLPEISTDAEYFFQPPLDYKSNNTSITVDQLNNDDKSKSDNLKTIIDSQMTATKEKPSDTPNILFKPDEDEAGTDNKQREVKVVKKTVKKEQKTEEVNGDQNGDTNVEAELSVKLPTKKTGAKTETKVEVTKKILPDGTVEEVKTTTTKTTIDGRTEIKTKTETRTLPKEEAEEEIEVEEEEEQEQENGEVIVQEIEDDKEITEELQSKVNKAETEESSVIKQNGQDDNIIKTEERSETTTTTTKKVVVVQSDAEEPAEEVEEEEIEEEEEVEDVEPVTVSITKQTEKISVSQSAEATEEVEEDVKEEVEEHVKEEVEEDVKEEVEAVVEDIKEEESESKKEVEEQDVEEEEEEEEEEFEEVKETPVKKVQLKEPQEEEEEDVQEEEEYEEAEEKEVDLKVEETKENVEEKVDEQQTEDLCETIQDEESEKNASEKDKVKSNDETVKEDHKLKLEAEGEKQDPKENEPEPAPQPEPKVPLREPSIPLEKVEDVEIKPIGPAEVISKTHTEKTEIITSTTLPPPGVHSTQTEYNRVENIVTVNRTTKTLDSAYENITQQGVPTVKTYFAPNIDRVLTSPMPSRPYQPVYTPEPTTERRHSLLLERLSVERQMPSEIYQYNNQTYEQQRQCSQEPQAEVLTISNVKPSTITNQQWYQQAKDNVIYNNVTSTPAPTTPAWTQPQPKVQQPTYKPQPTYPPQQTYQAQHTPQPQYQPQSTPQQQYQPQTAPQPQYQPQSAPQPQYQPSYTETAQDRTSNTYTTYTPKPNNWTSSNLDAVPSSNAQPNQYSFLNRESTDTYQKTTQQYSSSYVPPPWEQDSSYVVDNSTQNYYQPPPASTFTPTPTQSWKPATPTGKFSKPPPTAYIPPAPNQSFVKPVTNVEPPKMPGRKTYYSEYERRYISVPESTYIPHETKYQPQPDPSPQYYYDNNEPAEIVEPQWRKELREFTEKTQTQTEQTSVKPPWEVDTKYVKNPAPTYTPTPTWSQTLRPRSWRERSFESEYVGSQEWPKTNTLGRGRPLSSYGKNEPILERTRGVSVDRYNPNNYQSPSSLEHPPVQTHTLNPPAPHSTYHNPNVPSYHARASAEPRDQSASYKQPRTLHRDARISPLQSRSFKYLQWITGTED